MTAVAIAEDRSLVVPAGQLVRTGYVAVEAVTLACRDRMALGDVREAFERQLQLGAAQRWPCPRGHWSGERFIIVDGRHEYVAALMLGRSHLLVAWTEMATDPNPSELPAPTA